MTKPKNDLQAKAPQSNTESPMTITARGPRQEQVMNKRKSRSARTGTTPKQAVKKKEQPQGYNLGYFSLWLSRMDREGAREAVKSKRRYEDTGSSTRLRVILQGRDGRGRCASTQFDGPRMFETDPDKMLELKTRKTNRKVIHERAQDKECEWPQPMSKLRKLLDSGVDCQGGGTRDAKQRKFDVFLTDSQL
jgi:hypothetical protein